MSSQKPEQPQPSENLQQATLEWRNENTPVSSEYGDVYFSVADGAQESEFIFVQHNHLTERFTELYQNPHKDHFIIAETGFGTGLNFLQAAALWQKTRKNEANNTLSPKHLFFISTEIHPLNKHDLAQSLQCWPQLQEQASELIALYPQSIAGMHTLEFSQDITLILCQQDVLTGLQQLREHDFPGLKNSPGRTVDAWFLDGFAPSKNPDMWSDHLFQAMAQLSHRGTTLATFTAAGLVRRGLKAAGFSIQKHKGFGKKREMVTGVYQGLPTQNSAIKNSLGHNPYTPFWPVYKPVSSAPKTAIVIGAGIAGCTTTKALADAGIEVTLLDAESALMQKASGNRQGVLFPKLSHQQGQLAEFNLHSFLYAQRFYQQTRFKTAFHTSGMLQTIEKNKVADAEALIKRFENMPDLVTLVNSKKASQIANSHIKQDCLWYPSTGWFRQASVQEIFHDDFQKHKNVQFNANHCIESLSYHPQQKQAWTVTTDKGQQYQAEAVIICNAFAANQLLNSLDNDDFQLPLKRIRGQITQVDNQQLPQLHTTICHSGYITPADTLTPNKYNFGASYDLNDDNQALTADSQCQNIHKLANNLNDFSANAMLNQALAGCVAFRCTTPDYLPVIGPVPIKKAFKHSYKDFAKTSKAFIPETGSYYPGLMLNTGLGSRGFASAPLAAAIIKSYCCEQPFPITPELLNAVNPARFLIRDIIRRKA